MVDTTQPPGSEQPPTAEGGQLDGQKGEDPALTETIRDVTKRMFRHLTGLGLSQRG
jgi:hypothetical protein